MMSPALWAVLTAVFQAAVFHVVLRLPWSTLLADYDLVRGRLWPLVLLAQLFGPWLFARQAGRWPRGARWWTHGANRLTRG